MDKKTLGYLERVFSREIEGKECPLGPKIAAKMLADGLIEANEHQLQDRFGKVSYTLYSLTHKGRIAYCDSCRDVVLPK